MLNISGYELLEKIGEGGMATVWKARQLSLDRLVAIKLLDAASLPDETARQRFRQEAKVAAKLNHPGIVQVFDTGEVEGTAYLVMEFVDGVTVGDLIREQAFVAEARALEITDAVARALAYAWEKECLTHCDIKPDNILVDRKSQAVKVADLGLARMIGWRAKSPDDELIIGTPNYTAPEQSQGLPDLDCRTDMYALGATLYHMVTGAMPFRGSSGSEAMQLHEEDFLEDPGVINPALSVPTAWLIEKLMIKNRALRPHFWTQVLKDVESVRKGQLPFPPLPEPGASTVRRSPHRAESRAAKTQHSDVLKFAGEPKKLTIKKSDLAAMPVSAPARPSARVFSWFLLFLLMAGLGWGTLMYFGYVPVPAMLETMIPRNAMEEDPVEPVMPSPVQEAVQEAGSPAEEWRNEDFIQGAKLFNQALSDYKEYQQTRENPAMLKQIEQNLRDAIAHFEAARADAPPNIPIGQYIEQCNGLIYNVRQSTTLDMDKTGDAAAPAATDAKAGQPADTRTPTFVDDTPAEPAISPVPETPPALLRVAFDPAWEQPTAQITASGEELRRLLTRIAKPSRELMVDASVVLYPGITCMMSAREAARVLKVELPMRRALTTPGLPSGSLFTYEWEGEFSGARRLVLVVDQNSRVLMAQLLDDRPAPARMEPALYSPNWNFADIVSGRRTAPGDGLVAHRVRQQGNLIRLDTEVADPAAGERMVKERAQLNMPVQMAALILWMNETKR